MTFAKVETRLRGGDSPYGWERDAYIVKVGTESVLCTPYWDEAAEKAKRLNQIIRSIIVSAGVKSK